MKVLLATALVAGWAAISTTGQVPVPAAPLGTVAGASVQISGARVELDSQGRLAIFDGAHLSSAAGTAQLDLARGGAIKLCGPARLGLAAGGGGALLISLDSGGVNLRYATTVADSILTPDFRISTVVPPQQLATVSANAALAADGTVCLTDRGSALAVENLWTGDQRYVLGGQSLAFHPNGSAVAVAACPCASPLPPAVAVANGAEGGLFPAQPALTVNGNFNGTGAAAAPVRLAPHPHHNPLVRFLRWLVGKR